MLAHLDPTPRGKGLNARPNEISDQFNLAGLYYSYSHFIITYDLRNNVLFVFYYSYSDLLYIFDFYYNTNTLIKTNMDKHILIPPLL